MAKGQALWHCAQGHGGGQRWHDLKRDTMGLSLEGSEEQRPQQSEGQAPGYTGMGKLVEQGLHGLRAWSHNAWLKGGLR